MKCFTDIPGDTVQVGDALSFDPTSTMQTIPKSQFVECKNDHLDLEPFLECKDCNRKLHQVCVLHLEQIWPEGCVHFILLIFEPIFYNLYPSSSFQ